MTSHGMRGTKIYKSWENMRQRCNNPNNTAYSRYGGRGITVCDDWGDFQQFLSDMGQPLPGLQLDRIDNNGNYNAGNCRWATRSEQANNQRMRYDNKSGYRGIYETHTPGRWLAQIKFEGKDFAVGVYDSIREAVIERDKHIIINNLPHKLSSLFSEWINKRIGNE